MNEDIKKQIDRMSYEQMLRLWRFHEIGNPFFIDEIGECFAKVMTEKRKSVDAAAISKKVGWKV